MAAQPPTGHSHVPHVPHVTREDLGESPVWPTLAVLSAAALYATLPTRFISGPSSAGVFGTARWVVPALTVLLLVPLVLSVPQQSLVQSASKRAEALRLSRRILALSVIAVITIANAAAIALLVHLLVAGATTHARELLRAGIHMWCMNVLVFGLWYWQLDGGGPIERRHEARREPDFLDIVIAAVGVDQRVAGLFDRRCDGRVVVAERGAHLAGVEIELALAVDVFDLGAAARDENRAGSVAYLRLCIHAGAEAIAPCSSEQLGFAFHRRLLQPRGCDAGCSQLRATIP